MTESFVHTFAAMGTVVTIQVVGHGGSATERREREAAVQRAVEWFAKVTDCCNRFDATSEVRQLSTRIGEPTPASPILYEAVRFAVTVAEETDGAFDPTVGLLMEARGFDRDARSGDAVQSHVEVVAGVTWRDVHIDAGARTITLRRPLVIDLGAVAKGLAIDLAARELAVLEHFAVEAGGDLFVGGCNVEGEPWSVGIRHPRDQSAVLETLRVSNVAVCTSGDYERQSPFDAGHHIVDARTSEPADAVASVTVVAPTAIAADALATGAFALGPAAGIRFLEQQGVDGLMVTPTLERFMTSGMMARVASPNTPGRV